jgi:hypothetical protein
MQAAQSGGGPIQSHEDFDHRREFVLLRLISKNPPSNKHVVTCHAGWIFDAEEEKALVLSKDSLNKCCGTGTYVGIFWAIKFVLKKPVIKS